MEAKEHERRVGTTLSGKWKIERLLGVGGMAAVYVASHRLGRRETLKILHADAAKSDTLRARLEREARAANRVDHPAVVPIRDVDVTDDGCPFLVMDYVEGETLSARVARLGRVDAGELVPWAEEILGALQSAHERGIIHRDIKPENLLVQTDGKIRLLDFGIAKMTGEADGVRTQTGVTLGTASYMPPEQIRGGAIDGRADLFALAATMFRALAGRHIHGPLASEGDLLVRMATERAPPLRSVAPDVPDGVAQVVDLGLELDARRRYPDAATMREDLERARAGDAPPFATSSEAERDRASAARGPVTAPIAIPSAWDDVPPLPTQHAKTPVSIDAAPLASPAPLALAPSASGAVKTVPASSRRWAPVGRVIYGLGGALCAFFGLVLWLAFYDAKTRASVYVLMLLLATFPLAIAALLFARARTAHLAIRRPTDEAMRAVLAQAYASDARVAPGEIAATSGVPIDDAAQALEALTSAGAARRETTAEGYVVYTVARSRGTT